VQPTMIRPEVLFPVAIGPMRPTPFQRYWPLRADRLGLGAFVVAALAGLTAALTIPMGEAGLGWLITAVVTGAGLLVLGWNRGSARPNAEKIAWGGAVVALAAVGTFRASDWLFFLCVLTAVGCAAMSVVRGRTLPGMLLALFAYLVAPLRALPLLPRTVRVAPKAGVWRLLVSLALAAVLLMVFGALFASADPALEKIVESVVPDVNVDTLVRWCFLGGVVGTLTFGAAFLLMNPTTLGEVSLPAGRPVRRVEWALPVGAVLLAFAMFIGVQATVLFADRDYVLRTFGLTFAQYARRGFGQLVVVTLLTLLVMAVAARKAPRVAPADRMVLRLMLGALALGALVVVASAMWRMSVYEEAYGFTRLRLFVSTVELWLGVVFVLVLLAGVRLGGRWIAQAALATWVLTLIGLALLNPDRFVAQQNVNRFEQTHKVDTWYLSTLSADAAPELDRLPADQRRCALIGVAEYLRQNDDAWGRFNVARHNARRITADVTDATGCPFER
jgi:hypothetical protein